MTGSSPLRSCTYPYNPGLSQKQRNKATVFFLTFIGKIRTLGLVLRVKITSSFLGARCESSNYRLLRFYNSVSGLTQNDEET
jgi:hypothetical protein